MEGAGYTDWSSKFLEKAYSRKCSIDAVRWAKLIVAAKQDNTEEVLQILKKDPELVYTADEVGETVFHVLARAGHELTISKMMQFMEYSELEKVLHKKNIDGDTALHLAIKNKHKMVAAYVLMGMEDIARKELMNKDGLTPFDLAKKEEGWDYFGLRRPAKRVCRLQVVDIEMSMARSRGLEKLSNNVKWIDSIPRDVRDAFLQASAKGVIRSERIQLLVKFMTNSELASLPIESDNEDNTPLHLALLGKHEASALYLIEVAPKASYLLNKQGVSPLYLVIELGYQDMVTRIFQLMPATAIDISTRNRLLRANKASVELGYPHMVTRIFQLMPATAIDISTRNRLLRANKPSVVHAAVRARNLGMLEKIMEEFPDLIDSENVEGWKPLSYAAYEGYLDEVRYFLVNFPNSTKTYDRDGSFPIHKAVGIGHVHIVKEFISYCPSNIHDVDRKGRSILHIVVRNRRGDVFSYLTKLKEVEKIFHFEDLEGKTFVDYANKLKTRGKDGTAT